MIHYLLHDQEGFIVESGTAQVAPEPDAGETLQLLDDPLLSQEGIYWKAGLKPLPEKPSRFAIFDYVNEVWVNSIDLETVDKIRTTASSELKRAVAEKRQMFITSLPGQDGIYLEKRSEAIQYLAADPEPADLSDYPFLLAETGITAPTAYELSQLWLNLNALWIATAAGFEKVRMTAMYAFAEAQSVNEIETIMTTAKADLISLVEK
jgi:hypothetical protein